MPLNIHVDHSCSGFLFAFQSHQLFSLGHVACEDCGKEFTDASAFRTHHHTHTHPFKCSACNHRFQTRVGFGELMPQCVEFWR